MANWVRDFLAANSDKATWRVHKRARHALHLVRPDGQIEAHFTTAPMHYEAAPGDWQPMDTSLVDLGNGYWGAPGLIVRFNKGDKTVEIVGTGYSQRTTRVAVLRPSTMSLVGTPLDVPIGTRDDDSLVASGTIGGADWEHRLRLTETGVRETLTLDSLPSLSGSIKATDYLILETIITGATFPDGQLDELDDAGVHFPLPLAFDGNHLPLPMKRYARNVSGVQYIYTGIAVGDLAKAVYPVTIDPDFYSDAGDGYVVGGNAPYSTSHVTSAGYVTAQEYFEVGQQSSSSTNVYVIRGFLKFPGTSSITADGVVTQVNLTMTPHHAPWSATAQDILIMKQDWSAQDPLSNVNREAAYDNCLAGTQDDHIWHAVQGLVIWTQYTSGNLSTAWINKTGTTYYSLISSLDLAGTAPVLYSNDKQEICAGEYVTALYRPTLTVVYSVPTIYPLSFAGALDSSGAVVLGKAFSRAFSGALASSGALARVAKKGLGGTLASTGTLAKRKAMGLAGTLASTGTLARKKLIGLAGTLGSSGSLARERAVRLAGTLVSTGVLVKLRTAGLAGALVSSGALATGKAYVRAFGGALVSGGELVKTASKAFAGTLVSSAGLVVHIVIHGAITAIDFVATLSSSGTLAKTVSKGLDGGLATAGQLVKGITKAFGGALRSVATFRFSFPLKLLGEVRRVLAFDGQVQRVLSVTGEVERLLRLSGQRTRLLELLGEIERILHLRGER